MTPQRSTRPAGRRPFAPSVAQAGRAVRLHDVVRSLAATVVLLALIVGMPIALVALAPVGLPDHVPNWVDVVGFATRPDDGTLFLGALTVVAWLAWAGFTLSTFVEVVARLRGLTAVRLPLLGLTQHGAAALVAAALTVTSTGPLALRLVEPAATVATATLTGSPASQSIVPAEAAPTSVLDDARAQSSTGRQIVVERYDTLWGLAERHLGDGRRYSEIADLNYGRRQADGNALDDSHWLRPGWVLVLPAGADTPQVATPRDSIVTVDRGDTLWDIARDHLGDPLRYPDIFDINEGRPQPDGGRLEDPDLIHPGWRLQLPAPTSGQTPDADPAPATHAPSTPEPSPPVRPSLEDTDPARPTPPPVVSPEASPTQPAPATTPEAPAAPSSTEAPVIPRPEETPAAPATTEAAGDIAVGWTALVLGLTGLASAALLNEILVRRRRQQRHRRPGQVVPLPAPDPAALERQLRAAHDPTALARVHSTLQALDAACAQARRGLPRLAALLVAPRHIDLLLEDDEPPVAPFTAVASGAWRYAVPAPGGEPNPVDGTGVGGLASPYSGLVSVGATAEGLVLVNLDAAGTLTVRGPGDDVTAVHRALAVELVTSPLSRDAEVSLGPDLDELADVAQNASSPRSGGADAGLRIRVCANAHEAVAAGSGQALVTTSVDGTALSTGWQLTVTGGRAARLEPLGLTLACQYLTPNLYNHALDLLSTAVAGPRHPRAQPSEASSTGSWVDAGRPPGERRVAAGPAVALTTDSPPRRDAVTATPPPDVETVSDVQQAPRVLLLGSVAVLGADDGAVPNRRRRLTELVAYLSLHPGATYHQLDEALWPGKRVPTDTRNATVSRARRWLGANPDGEPYLPIVTGDADYRLHPAVTSDWQDFLHLARQAVRGATIDADRLAEAMLLVRGRPFLGVDPRDYGWAEPDIQEMITAIVDAAHTLADARHRAGDHRPAQDAAGRGLLAEPCSELLHRDAIRAAAARGDRADAIRLVDRLRAHVERLDPDGDLEPETIALLKTLGLRRA